jgi:hypothetical protein
VLPTGTSAERALRRLRHEIVEMGGTAVLLSCTTLVGESDVLLAFQAARDDEYEEIVGNFRSWCASWLVGVVTRPALAGAEACRWPTGCC